MQRVVAPGPCQCLEDSSISGDASDGILRQGCPLERERFPSLPAQRCSFYNVIATGETSSSPTACAVLGSCASPWVLLLATAVNTEEQVHLQDPGVGNEVDLFRLLEKQFHINR